MRIFQLLACTLVLLVMVACQSAPQPGYEDLPNVVEKRAALQKKLVSLVPESQRQAAQAEATWLADTAYRAAAAIGRYNDPVFVNWLNNRAVNTRKHYRHRGLCWHYQHDLYRELRRRPLHYFSLGCCVRDRGRGGEHHVVYIKAKNGQWPSIIMLDAWWYAGRLKVEDESDAEDWVDDPKSTEILNTIYPAGHQRPMEHWSMVRKGTRYADYVYSDLPAARDSAQWKHMQKQMKEGLKRRGGKPFEY